MRREQVDKELRFIALFILSSPLVNLLTKKLVN